MAHYVRNQPGEAVLIRPRQPWRDSVEGLLSALVLVLIIRHFAFEVFKIPTGSMAPTLLGQHRDIVCPNCQLRFPVDAGPGESGQPKVLDAECPNCHFFIGRETVGRTFCTCFPSKPQRLFWQGGNRVIADKFMSKLRPPERWQVVVFKYPYGDMDYIKRLIGLPGETITIRHGDIYANGVLQRKPPIVQEETWRLVYDSRYPPKGPIPPYAPRWRAELGTAEERGGQVVLHADNGEALARYASPITDYTAYNGSDGRGETPNGIPVGDLQWEVTAQFVSAGTLRLGVEEDHHTYFAEVQFGETGRETLIASNQGEVLAHKKLALATGTDHTVRFSNADDHIELSIDGQPALEYAYDTALDDVPARPERNGAWLGALHADATLKRVRLNRDLYYVPIRPNSEMYNPVTGAPRFAFTLDERNFVSEFRVDENGYFVLGDNTRNSADSRYWGSFPKKNLIGRAVVVWWPFGQLRPLY